MNLLIFVLYWTVCRVTRVYSNLNPFHYFICEELFLVIYPVEMHDIYGEISIIHHFNQLEAEHDNSTLRVYYRHSTLS